MLKPIPRKILTHTITLKVCTGTDVWQNPTFTAQTIENVCMQPSNETLRSQSNTEVVLRALLFIDARRSTPAGINLEALKTASESAGAQMQVVFDGTTYTVRTVERMFDDTGAFHHTEVGLV